MSRVYRMVTKESGGPMKRFLAIVTAVLVLGIAPPEATARAYSSCTQMHNRYPHGVAKSRRAARQEVADGYGRPAVNRRVYRQNRDLDANDDGVACEA
jgi:hypothetical protein